MMLNMKKINLKNIFLRTLLASLLFSLPIISFAAVNCSYNSFEEWKDCFIEEKLSGKFDSHEAGVIKKAEFTQRAIDLDQKQPEKKLSYSQYLNLIGFQNKIVFAKKYLNDNRALVSEVATHFNIEPEVIVALVGMESDFGKVQGKFNIVDTVATLAYEGRRRNFFEAELIHILSMAKQDGLTYEELKGSWAGAMGQVQFMPSSFNSYAVDFNNDGRRDIWGTKEDIYASAANYLIKNGWQKNHTHAKRFAEAAKSQVNIENCAKNNEKCGCDDTYCLISMKYDDTIHRSYLVGKNFDVLMKWNKSYYFCLSVMLIANELKKEIR